MIGNVAWSPEGRSLAFALMASRTQTWVIENPLTFADTLAAVSR
jgi:hypothetical protein